MSDHWRGMGPQPARRRPGLGAAVAVTGLVLFAVAALGLPWTSGADELTLAEIGNRAEVASDAAAVRPWKFLFLERYADEVALRVVILLAVAVAFSTLVVPRSRALRVLLGSVPAWGGLPHGGTILILAGVLGLLVNLIDPEGGFGPRVAAVLTTLAVLALHGLALDYVLLDPDPAPDPAFGVWVGLLGLAAVLVGTIIGTREVAAPAP
jgi:hypothetical protein